MSFDSPAALWLLGAVPIIVLLWLLRPRRPRVRIPSVMLWPTSPAERQSARPWQRLRNHPLLWLQLLAAVLLALAAAQPFIPSEAAEQRVIVLLDASGSMRAHDVSPSRWDAAVSAVVDLAQKLGPDQKLSIVRADDQPRVLLADTRDVARVESTLKAESPGFARIDTQTSLSLAAGLAQGKPSEWILVGDGHFPDVASGTIPPDTRLEFVPIGTEHAGNVALTGLSLRANASTFALQAGIRNASDVDATGAVQLVSDAGMALATANWQAAPHAETYVSWDGIQSGPRWFEARLANVTPADANALDTDDRAITTAPNAATLEQRALLVTSGNTFLERALAVEGSLRTFKVSPADLPQLASQDDASGYALVVFDRETAATLPTVRANTLRIGSISTDEFHPRLIAPVPDHPLVRNVDWSEVRIGRARHLPPAEAATWETVVDSDGGPLLLIRTVRDDDRPRREAMLTFELGESDLPLRPAFPVLMANLLDWLAPRTATNLQSVAPGGALPIETSPLTTSLRIEPVDESSSQVEHLAPPWPARPFHPAAPGVYQLIAENPDGSSVNYVVADAFAPTEADLARGTPELMHESASQLTGALSSVRAGIWPWILAALLVLAAAEWLVDARGR